MSTPRTISRSVLGLFCLALIACGSTARAQEGVYFADIFYPGWSDGHVYRVDADGTGLQTISDVGGGLRGFAVDPSGGKLYWSDVEADVIRRANLDGTSPEELITSGLSWPMAIALHPGADLLAWGDQSLEIIGTAHLNGSGAAPLLSTPFAAGIAFDRVHQKIYWSTATTGEEGEILRADLDGTDVEVVVTGAGRPARIALDVTGAKIYWTDYVVDAVRRANLDGTGLENLYVVGSNLNPDGIGLDLVHGKVYWAQSVTDDREKIMRMNLDGSNPEDFLVGDFGIIMDIVVVPDEMDAVEAHRAAVPLSVWPNPCAGHAAIRFSLGESREVHLTVHTVTGRLVTDLVQARLSAGTHSFTWDGMDDHGHRAGSGTYYCRLDAGAESWTRPLGLVW